MWPTPTTCGNHNRRGISKNSGDGLSTAVKQMFPTPMANDAKNATLPPSSINRDSIPGHLLREIYATPQARDYRTGQRKRWDDPNRSRNLNDQIGGALNPDWVDWLMGFPSGWTNPDTVSIKTHDPYIWNEEPDIPRLAKQVKHRVSRLKADGNAVVPRQAYPIFAAIMEVEEKNKCLR